MPALSCCCCCTTGKVGQNQGGAQGHFLGQHPFNGKNYFIDCALVSIESTVGSLQRMVEVNDGKGNLLIRDIHGVEDATVGMIVKKIGVNGYTTGKVEAIDFGPANLHVEFRTATLDVLNVIKISPLTELSDGVLGSSKAFCSAGDSGSLVLNQNNNVVGLLFAADAAGFGYAAHIKPIMDKLQITIDPTPSASAQASLEAESLAAAENAENEFGFWSDRLERYKKEIMTTEQGRTIMELAMQHREEILALVNRNRAVTVTWRRKNGPSFLAALMKCEREEGYTIPAEIGGTSLHSLLSNMAIVLQEQGSEALGAAIRRYTVTVLNLVHKTDTLAGIVSNLKEITLPGQLFTA